LKTKGCPGLAHRTVRCATGQCPVPRENHSKLLSLGFLKMPLRYNSPAIRCSTGLSGVPCGATTTAPTIVCKVNSEQCVSARVDTEQRRKAHQTVNSACSVRHQTIRCYLKTKLQRSNPNGWVMWLAHQTVSGDAPNCPVRPSIAAPPNDHFDGWGYKYPQPPHFMASKFFRHLTQYKS
jgi:hypothetical protein